MPYHVTWAHELENGLAADEPCLVTVAVPAAIAGAVAQLAARATS
jgi:putative hydrolase of the HAD superfamily